MKDRLDPPTFPDAGARTTIGEALRSAGFSEMEICGRLGVAGWREFGEMGRMELLWRADGIGAALGVLLRLFRTDFDVDGARAEAALGDVTLSAMEASGLLRRDGPRVRAQVALTSVSDLVFAADLPARHRSRAADFVLGAGGVTRRLADFTLRAPVDTALDLGCGAGVLAGLAAAHATRVVATDINPRAVAFSRFNAELNGLSHVECREGSLFEPVAGDRFDLIVCNPPYVISPGTTYVYRDGGTELCRGIVREAAEHLTPSGTLQMLVEWPERVGMDWREEVAGWLDGAGCDAWLLRLYSDRAERYAARWLSQEFEGLDRPDDPYARWMEYLGSLGISSVGGGLLILRPSRGARARIELRKAPPIVEPAGPSVARWLACQSHLARVDGDPELLDTVFAPAPDLERTARWTTTGSGWIGERAVLRLRTGLAFGARVDPVAAEIVGLLDGRRTPRQALDAFCDHHGVAAESFLGGLPGALRRLVALGILVPVD